MKNLGKVAKETNILTGTNGRMQINYNGETVWSDYFPDLDTWIKYHDGSIHFFTSRPMTAEEIEARFTSDKANRMLNVDNKSNGVR